MIISGKITEIKKVDVDITLDDIFKAAHQLSNNQILLILKEKMINIMKERDHALVEVDAQLNWDETEWEVYDFFDQHKREHYFTRYRIINNDEKYIIEIFNILFKMMTSKTEEIKNETLE